MTNQKRRFFLRYISIIQKIRNNPASFGEIESYLKRQSRDSGENLAIAKRTFQRDLNDIRDVFNIVIKSNSLHEYYISDEGDPDQKNRMLETFDQLDLLYKTKNPSQYIYYEKRISNGSENLNRALHAIRNRILLSFKHEKYWEESETERTVEPIAIKESQHRWYLIAKDRKDKRIKTFGMDRISDLKLEKDKFEYPKDFSHDKMFSDSFGVITKGVTEEIILSFTKDQEKYLGSLMIHSTQTKIDGPANKYIIRLRMKVTHDLVKEILSYGNDVEVIAPKSLRNEIRKIYTRALKYYSKV